MKLTTIVLGCVVLFGGWSALSGWHGLSDRANESIQNRISNVQISARVDDVTPHIVGVARNESLRRLFASGHIGLVGSMPSFVTVLKSESPSMALPLEVSSWWESIESETYHAQHQVSYTALSTVLPLKPRLEPRAQSHLKSFHESTIVEFEQAPGNGRSRGGAHVLMSDGAVQFLTDTISIATTDASESVSPYGLWGALGTRNHAEQLSEPKPVASSDMSFNQHVRNLATDNQHKHRFGFDYLTPYFSDPESQPMVMDEIQLVSVELNRVYLIDQNMTYLPDLAKDTPFRELDQFETDALRQLSDGKEVVTAKIADEYRMLGALRNTVTCIECHNGDPSLLGAFTYRFRD